MQPATPLLIHAYYTRLSFACLARAAENIAHRVVSLLRLQHLLGVHLDAVRLRVLCADNTNGLQ
jgi:hypothetical protein